MNNRSGGNHKTTDRAREHIEVCHLKIIPGDKDVEPLTQKVDGLSDMLLSQNCSRIMINSFYSESKGSSRCRLRFPERTSCVLCNANCSNRGEISLKNMEKEGEELG